MADAEEHCFKTPQAMSNSSPAATKTKNNNKMPIAPPASQSPHLPNAGTTPKRIISKIPLDFKKLKDAGLHRKLAMALSKQNMNSKEEIASAASKQLTSNAPTSSAATAITWSTPATHTHMQQLVEQTSANAYTGNSTPVTSTEQSLNVKKLIKNKILNKSSQLKGQQQQPEQRTIPTPPKPTPCSGTSGGRSPQSGGFTVPIAKADLTARTKPPILLNMINQLPKQRATCGTPRRRKQPVLPKSVSTPAPPPRPASNPIAAQPKSPPLIVLENKVLAPDERIDFRTLRLPNGQPGAVAAPTSPIVLPSAVDKKELPSVEAVNSAETSPSKAANGIQSKLIRSSPTSPPVKKVIWNMSKRKLPREQIAQLAKEVRKQALEHVQQQPAPPVAKPVSVLPPVGSLISTVSPIKKIGSSLISKSYPSGKVEPMIDAPILREVSSIEITSSLITPRTVSATHTKAPSSPAIAATLMTPVSETPTASACASEKVLDALTTTSPITEHTGASMSAEVMQSSETSAAFSVRKSPNNQEPLPSDEFSLVSSSSSPKMDLKGDSTSDEISAVDFITQLTAIEDVDASNFFELSPEELSMNAKFGCAKVPALPPSNVTKPDDDLAIGKILQLQDMDILHATLNVNGNKPNVLCISPNAIALQSSAEPVGSECPIVEEKEISASPQNEHTDAEKKLATFTSPVDEVPEKKVVEEPSVNAEAEKVPPPKPLPSKSKKRKVNLVTRSKRTSASLKSEESSVKVTKMPQETSEMEVSSETTTTTSTSSPAEVTSKDAESKAQLEEEAAMDITETDTIRSPSENMTNEDIDDQEQSEQAPPTENITADQSVIKDIGSPNSIDESAGPVNGESTPMNTENESLSINQGINENREKPKEKEVEQSLNISSSTDSVCQAKDADMANTDTDQIVISEETKDVATTEETVTNTQPEHPAKERDLTQLYHPPKVPKHKLKTLKKNDKQNGSINDEEVPDPTPAPSVSLFDVVQREPPPPQGEPQLPFRSSDNIPKKPKHVEHPPLGIQNLISHLAAEDIVPEASKEAEVEEKPKTPRKKLVKTRPVLSTKRAARAAPPLSKAMEQVQTRKRPLPVESKANGAHRVKSSSTSDDDGSSFHGFDELPSLQHFKASAGKETDISDDASPDQDETEEERHSDKDVLAKKPKTESVVDNEHNKSNDKIVAESKEPQLEPTAVNVEVLPQEEHDKETTVKSTASKEDSAESKPQLQSKPKRGRKSKKVLEETQEMEVKIEVEKPNPSPVQALPDMPKTANDVATPTPVKRKRGRPRKSAIITDTPSADTSDALNSSAELATPNLNAEVSEVTTSTPVNDRNTSDPFVTPVAKRRRRKSKTDQVSSCPGSKVKTESSDEPSDSSRQTSEHFMRLLLIRSRPQLESGEELREDGRGKGNQQCGLCLARCSSADWQKHLGEHYGIGWSVDEPAPLLTRSLVMKMIKAYIDAGNKSVSCRLCQRSLTSALGMLLHLEGCGAKERIVCEYCKSSYTKLSFPGHTRTCSKRLQATSDETQLTQPAPEVENTTPVYSNAGRAKRKSTLKAETKLEKIAAQIKEPTVDDLGKDFEGDVSDYDMTADKESSDGEESEGVDSNATDERRSSSKVARPTKSGQKTLYTRLNMKNVKKERWNYFTERNYARDTLYPHLLPSYEQLSAAEASRFLPAKESTSMRYAYDVMTDDNWTQLKPLESLNKKDESICYLGSAIKEVAWVPLPSTVETQYLLCSLRYKVLGYSRQFKEKPEKSMLLLLECKTSSGDSDKVFPLQTRLHYGISMPQGAVHSLAFMASGGYDESINRLGLLAVGSASGAAIYSLPLLVKKESKQREVVIVPQPVITLTLDMDHSVQDPCSKICWSESSGHGLLVTGYASGNVAFFDISDKEGLNCIEHNNQTHFLPANFFYFGERNIAYLELHYDTNGARWLAVGTMVRKFWIYDIANISLPLAILGDTVCNMYTGDLTWPPLWESMAIGCTELYKSQFPRVLALNPSGITFSHSTIDLTLSSTRSVHFDSEQLTMAAVTDNGDVAFIRCNQFNVETTIHKRTSDCRSVSVTEPWRLGATPETNSISPDEFKEDYGLLVKPLQNVPNKVKSTYINIKRRPNFDLLNLLRLNCVRWNWNESARNWVAVGAEHGLLRIFNFEADKHFNSF